MAYDYNSLFSPFTSPFSLVNDTAEGVGSAFQPIGTYASQAPLPKLPNLTGSALDAYIAGQTSSPGGTPAASGSSSGYTGNSFVDAILGWDPFTGKVDTPTNNVLNGGGGQDVASTVLKDWTVARFVTIFLGLILIIVGLFALTRGPAVQIVGDIAREAAVG